jgi:hypothetical protein
MNHKPNTIAQSGIVDKETVLIRRTPLYAMVSRDTAPRNKIATTAKRVGLSRYVVLIAKKGVAMHKSTAEKKKLLQAKQPTGV